MRQMIHTRLGLWLFVILIAVSACVLLVPADVNPEEEALGRSAPINVGGNTEANTHE